MTEPADRRVQLRESIHQLVVYWSERRGITPAALVSVAVYEYLRTCGELNVTPVTTTKPPAAPTPAPARKPALTGNPWLDDEDDAPAPKRNFSPKSTWPDDEEDDASTPKRNFPPAAPTDEDDDAEDWSKYDDK